MTVSLSPGGPINRLLTTWNDAVGHTVKSVMKEKVAGCFCNEILVFRFTDGSGLVLHSNDEGAYWGDPDALSDDYGDNQRQRVHLGLETLEAYKKAEAERSAQYAARTEAGERAMFERLKQKYGEQS